MQLGQQLWTRPVYPHPDDEEFESSELGSEWYCYSLDTSDYGSIEEGTVDIYDTTFSGGETIRVNVNTTGRPSWMFLQPPDQRNLVLGRTYTLPTNVLIIARMKFNLFPSIVVSPDRSFSLWLAADTAGKPDMSNRVAIYGNYNDAGTTRALFVKVDGGTPSTYKQSTDTQAEGTALEYFALHKIGTTYHGWVGTASGNWIWMGSESFTPTIAHLNLYVRTDSTDKPGVGVFGIDFLRFYETDNFLF